MKEGLSKPKGVFGGYMIWGNWDWGVIMEKEKKLLIYLTSNFCSEFAGSDFFKPFGVSPQPFNIL